MTYRTFSACLLTLQNELFDLDSLTVDVRYTVNLRSLIYSNGPMERCMIIKRTGEDHAVAACAAALAQQKAPSVEK